MKGESEGEREGGMKGERDGWMGERAGGSEVGSTGLLEEALSEIWIHLPLRYDRKRIDRGDSV